MKFPAILMIVFLSFISGAGLIYLDKDIIFPSPLCRDITVQVGTPGNTGKYYITVLSYDRNTQTTCSVSTFDQHGNMTSEYYNPLSRPL